MIRVLATIHPDLGRSTFEEFGSTSPLPDDMAGGGGESAGHYPSPCPLPEAERGEASREPFQPPLRLGEGAGGGVIQPVTRTSPPHDFADGAPAVVAVGKFFAVHRGHEALITEAVQRARARGARSVVFTFDRHPIEVLRPGTEVSILTTTAERLALIERLGVDVTVIARVTSEFLSLTPEQFVRDVLHDRLGTVEIVASASFRFGRGASGTLETLRELGTASGMAVDTLPEVLVNGERISSSRIADEIAAGRVESAAELLGRPYSLCGTVIAGERLGRQLGFPTANLQVPPRRLLPADGIYAVVAAHAGRLYAGVAHLGPRPAVGGLERTLEAHLLDVPDDLDLYGRTLRLHFVHRLRGIEDFASLSDLTRQIARDVDQARSLLPADERSLANLAWFDKEGQMC